MVFILSLMLFNWVICTACPISDYSEGSVQQQKKEEHAAARTGCLLVSEDYLSFLARKNSQTSDSTHSSPAQSPGNTPRLIDEKIKTAKSG